MKNKLSQFFINYMKNKKCKTFNQGGVDLSKNDPKIIGQLLIHLETVRCSLIRYH
jgi:hypothetical protein